MKNLKQMVENFEKSVITVTLRDFRWNMKAAARELEIEYQALYLKCRKYGLLKSQRTESAMVDRTTTIGIDPLEYLEYPNQSIT